MADSTSIEAGCSRCAALEAELLALKAELAALKEKVGQDPSNSHRPPSSSLRYSARGKKKKSGRKKGAQPGHAGKRRELLPPEQVDHIVECRPEQCEKCCGTLSGTDRAPQRHQVSELPVVRPVVTEYQLHRLYCPHCESYTRAGLPEGVPSGAFGPGVQATVALLSGGYRLSVRSIQSLLEELFGLKLSLGSVIELEQRSSRAIAQASEELLEYAQEEPALHIDETRFRQAMKLSWLWAIGAPDFAVFRLSPSRARQIALGLVEEDYQGVLHSDRYAVYDFWPDAARQLCWSHLTRDFYRIARREGDSTEIGEALVKCSEEMFHQWHRFGREEIRISTFQSYLSAIRVRVRELLRRGTKSQNKRTARTCEKILKREKAMYNFARYEGAEPTNNHIERQIRHAVQWRKTSYGTDSERGSRFVERILTVVQTCRLQGRSLFDYLLRACRAQLWGLPAPSLIPNTS